MVAVSLVRASLESGDPLLPVRPGARSAVVVTAPKVVTIQVESTAGEDGETPEGGLTDLSELVITVLVVCIGVDVLLAGLVVGRLEVWGTDSTNGVGDCAELEADVGPPGVILFPLLVRNIGPKQWEKECNSITPCRVRSQTQCWCTI